MSDLVFHRRYAMAHRLLAAPSSKCIVPHGHNEIVSVRLAPKTRFSFGGANALAPFETIKRRWHDWIDNHVDHAFQLNQDDPLIGFFREHEPERLKRIMTFLGDPTTEALAACFWLKLDAFLNAEHLPFTVSEVRVEETPTNVAIVTRDNFDADACGLPQHAWPRRADLSINEF
jgi:6-pyruvoyltetrahydropterin/6-carboxytetrahydropterin synthase